MRKRLWLAVLILSLGLGLSACQKSNESSGEPGAESGENLVSKETDSSPAQDGTKSAAETEEKGTDKTTAEETTAEKTTAQETAAEETTTWETTAWETEAETVVSNVRTYITELEGQQPENSIHSEVLVTTGGDVIQRYEMGTTVTVDLDGDGAEEKLTVAIGEKKQYWEDCPIIQVDDFYFDTDSMRELTRYMEAPDTRYFYLTDLDVNDGWKEIALYESGPSGDPVTTFLRYSDGKLVWIGTIAAQPAMGQTAGRIWTASGDGQVTARVRYDIIETSFTRKAWKLANATELYAEFEEIVPEYYEFLLSRGEERPYLVQDMTFYGERAANTENFVTLPAGTYIEFTRFYPEEGWLEIVSEGDGQTVWLKLETRDGKGVFLPGELSQWGNIQGDYIKGLCMAD